jgi:hypothetical protein
MDKSQWERVFADLDRRGIRKSMYAPPIYQLAWKLGLNVAPPLFAPFVTIFLSFGIYFGALWGGAMWLLFWSHQAMPGRIALFLACLAGLLFGVVMASWYRHKARRYALPDWTQYCSELDR